ncbi:MAG TPA: class F sortase, partial [Micromonospora sp.]
VPDPDLGSRPTPTASRVGMARSAPTRIVVPRIGIDAGIMSLGLRGDGSLEVPPLKQAQLAGWYRGGPSPGEIGNSVIVGHVDSRAMGPAVFYRLGALTAGDEIAVAREDGAVARFRVDSVASYPKKDFPTELVYGPTGQPSLRLVTCGGQFDSKKRTYLNNIVVTATLDT